MMKFLHCKPVIKYSVFLLQIIAYLLFSSSGYSTEIHSNIPDIGQTGNWGVSTEKQKKMGQVMLQQINQQADFLEDPVINEYLMRLSRKLEAVAPRSDFRLHFFAIQNPTVNAFAFFGGHIAVHSELIKIVDSENELAAVLSHETAHIIQHHLARILDKSKRLTPLTFAELLAALALGSLGGGEAGMHLATAVLGGHMQQMINFTREHEQEADRIGLQILTDAGFDPQGMPSVLDKLDQKTKFHHKPPEYLLTHPMFASRIADVQNRAHKIPYQKKEESLEFQLVKARLTVELAPKNRYTLRLFKLKSTSDSPNVQFAHRYAYCLALAKYGKKNEAKELLTELLAREPDAWVLELSMAEFATQLGHYDEAMIQFEKLKNKYPDNSAILMRYVELLLESKQGQKAIPLLLKLKLKLAHEPRVWENLAKAYSQAAKRMEVHEAKALYHYWRSEYPECLQQFDLALEYASRERGRRSLLLEKKAMMQQNIDELKAL